MDSTNYISQVNNITWYYRKIPIGYIIKIGYDGTTKTDEEYYYCTCHSYTYDNITCDHILSVIKMRKKKSITKEDHLKILFAYKDEILHDLRLNETDKFDYHSYFNDGKNFDLILSENGSRLLWHGYEMTFIRHQLGELIRDISKTENIQCYRVKDTNYQTGMMEIFNIQIVSDVCKKCPNFTKCSACHICRHMAKCNCNDYNSGQICRHLHAVIGKIYPKRSLGYLILRQHKYIRSRFKRYYVLNMQTRIRHNEAISLKVEKDETSSEGYVKYEGRTAHLKLREKQFVCECIELNYCNVCKICAHTYVCDCADNKAGFICVHLHAFHLHIEQKDVLKRIENEQDWVTNHKYDDDMAEEFSDNELDSSDEEFIKTFYKKETNDDDSEEYNSDGASKPLITRLEPEDKVKQLPQTSANKTHNKRIRLRSLKSKTLDASQQVSRAGSSGMQTSRLETFKNTTKIVTRGFARMQNLLKSTDDERRCLNKGTSILENSEVSDDE